MKRNIQFHSLNKSHPVITVALVLMALILSVTLLPLNIHGQGFQNFGAKIVINQGTYLNISEKLNNQPSTYNGVIEVNGTLKLKGNLENNSQVPGGIIFDGLDSELILDGINSQVVHGNNLFTFKNVTVNNVSRVTFSSNASIEGNLALTSGVILLNNSILTLGNGSSIIGTPSSTAMIVTGESGEIRKQFTSTGSFTFPVGSSDETLDYTPVTISLQTGTFSDGSFIGVNSSRTAIYHAQPYLTRLWQLTQSGISSFIADVSFQYLETDVSGDETNIHCIRTLPEPITILDAADLNTHRLTASSLSSFGTFTGGASNKTLNLTFLLEGLYASDGLMHQARDQSSAKWPEGVADHFTLELHNSADYNVVEYSQTDVSLATNGNTSLYLPLSTIGEYYITIKHPGSLETTSSIPVSFVENVIDWSFTNPSNVLGANLKNINGNNVIYCGDVNGDGFINRFDILQVHGLSKNATRGYMIGELNGDGLIDLLDLVIIFNNTTIAAEAFLP